MRALKILLLILVVGVVLSAAGAAVLWILASATPDRYQPAELSENERRQVGYDFISDVVQRLHNEAQYRKPFDLVLTEKQLNGYLASMDEIIAIAPGRELEGHPVRDALDKAGVDGLAVALRGGKLTLMGRLSRHDKVVSIDVVPRLEGGMLRVDIEGVRIGSLPIPNAVHRALFDSARPSFDGGSSRERPAGESEFTSMTRVFRDTLVDNAVEPVFHVGDKDKPIRLERIDIDGGEVRFRFVPHEPASADGEG